jgi:hypothetical protein
VVAAVDGWDVIFELVGVKIEGVEYVVWNMYDSCGSCRSARSVTFLEHWEFL